MYVGVGKGRQNKTLSTHFTDENMRGVTDSGTSVVLVGPRKRVEKSLVLLLPLLSANPTPLRLFMKD